MTLRVRYNGLPEFAVRQLHKLFVVTTFYGIEDPMRCLPIFVLFFCVTANRCSFGDEHVISRDRDVGSISWTYGDHRSARTGPLAQPGHDGPWRLHVKVKNGDLVFFTGSTVVFENGADEVDVVWEISEFL